MHVSGGCSQTSSGFGGSSAVLVVSRLSHEAAEWWHAVFTLEFGLQFEHSHLNSFEHFYVGPDSVLLVVCSVEAVYFSEKRLPQSNFSMWNG